ncbi:MULTISPECIES: aspartate dehydrogenase [unclassified Haematobacter]|uniref:aspartate dehydrogenase n=1 Tax=unclassified Haematobacter TaxID=2640585 RepID=UPI0025B7CEB9|nr:MULTISPECIES: aspartate dehydrogenase [unclassified Haematobacter]
MTMTESLELRGSAGADEVCRLSLGIIGFGAIASELLKLIEPLPLERLILLVSPGGEARARERLVASHPALVGRMQVTERLDDLIVARPGLVVEAAGHGAVDAHAARLLETGIDLLLVSIGALSDQALHNRLKAAAVRGGARILLPAGAIGGVDLLSALSARGALKVRYFGTKPPSAWRGTPVAETIDLERLSAPLEFFHGNAREAARNYPKNANVAATLALAGAGFEATEVTLIADPAATGNSHRYEVSSPLANYSVEITNRATDGNAKTSVSTVYSVLREIRNQIGPVAI